MVRSRGPAPARQSPAWEVGVSWQGRRESAFVQTPGESLGRGTPPFESPRVQVTQDERAGGALHIIDIAQVQTGT